MKIGNAAKKGCGVDYITKDTYHLMLKIALLARIRHGRHYSYELFRDINGRFSKMDGHMGVSFKPDMKNDVYNTISSLLAAGYIRSVNADGHGTKNYYSITAKGNAALDGAKIAFRRTVKEIMKMVS